MSIKNSLAGVAVGDLDAAISWYTRLLDREPDARPMAEVAEWKFAGGGWIQLFEDTEQAGSSSVTFVEPDLKATLNQLRARGVTLDAKAVDASMKGAVIHDPDGNQVIFTRGKPPASNTVAS